MAIANDMRRCRKRDRRSAPFDFERGTILAILGMLALGTYSTESFGADLRRQMQAQPVIKGSLAASDAQGRDAHTLHGDSSKIAVVVRPLDLSSLPADAFDDGQAETDPATRASALR